MRDVGQLLQKVVGEKNDIDMTDSNADISTTICQYLTLHVQMLSYLDVCVGSEFLSYLGNYLHLWLTLSTDILPPLLLPNDMVRQSTSQSFLPLFIHLSSADYHRKHVNKNLILNVVRFQYQCSVFTFHWGSVSD